MQVKKIFLVLVPLSPQCLHTAKHFILDVDIFNSVTDVAHEIEFSDCQLMVASMSLVGDFSRNG